MIVQLPVIAAIPNYNMADSLARLLPQLIAQGYDAVYVLDDASTDHSRDVVAQFEPAVTWVFSEQNGGAGAARNKVLEVHKQECIIHFLDADVRLETGNITMKARRLMINPNIAFTGGLALDDHGRQLLWNYGPDTISLYALLTALIQAFFGSVQAPKPLWRNTIRVLTKRARREWPDAAVLPKRRAVYWPVECNLLVRRSILVKLGGFDGTVREYDIIPPARIAYEMGLISVFDPSIVVTHLKVDVRHYNRPLALFSELHMLIKRYGGWSRWILPNGHFKPGHNQE